MVTKWARLALGVMAVGELAVSPALADGTFLQLDLGRETQGLVATTTQGRLTYGFDMSRYESGHSGALSLGYRPDYAPLHAFKIGPTLGFNYERGLGHDFEAGLKLWADHYRPTSFGAAYVLAEASSVHNAWFLLGQLTFEPSGFGLELSRGGSDTYHETTVTLQKRLTGTPYSLRAGYKAEAEEAFLGVSFNTF